MHVAIDQLPCINQAMQTRLLRYSIYFPLLSPGHTAHDNDTNDTKKIVRLLNSY